MENIELDLNEQLQNRRLKLKELQEEGKDPFHITLFNVDTKTSDILENFEEYNGKKVKLAGRLMTRRIMGKASFFNVRDAHGTIQVYINNTAVVYTDCEEVKLKTPEEGAYEAFKKFDIGDIVGIEGEVFKTQKEEISIRVAGIALLSKSLQVLPEKYHGLKDTEQRYRQRYLDLIVNPEVKETFKKRSELIASMREYLNELEYIEVETPVLQTTYGGAAAKPFTTHHNALNMNLFMRISLEPYLKRLIVGGIDKVYEIGRIFRNEGISTRHNPEFTMLELYCAYTDYRGIMALTEDMIKTLCYKINGTYKVNYDGEELDFSKKFRVASMIELVKEKTNIDFETFTDTETAKKYADEKGLKYEKHHTYGDILFLFFDTFVEKTLVQPTFVIDHPIEVSPLTKKIKDRPHLTERFELFIAGKELANAYSELNDPLDQRERFKHQESLRNLGDEEAVPLDEDFLTALEYAMPPTGGLGIGIDRLVMILTGALSIRDVILFPTMKPTAAEL
ncbi:MAG: lysine--tRNA ligase [Defluviitaleaceae bacterium]|nr:lysine--tRNA ligase [Defluviitaleaceae bacterium]